jgi:nitrate reductase delta subunit
VDERITLRALGALLTYPRPELRAALPEIADALAASRLLPRVERERLAALIRSMRETDGIELEGRYVELFDRGRSASLDLFEHAHGESRDRGQAMVDLKELYARAGLRLAAKELPDHLPVVLEYLSCRDLTEARAMLGDCAHILRRIGDVLAKQPSTYAAVFAAALALAGERGLGTDRSSDGPRERPLDDEWVEEPVIFGPAAGSSCGAKPPPASVIRFLPRPAARREGAAR